jgi:hypothetical protein
MKWKDLIFLEAIPPDTSVDTNNHNSIPCRKPLQRHQETAAGKLFREGIEPGAFICGKLILAHSKVYTFASQFLCPGLKSFALQRLEQVLNLAKAQPDNCFPELIQAIRHVYEKTLKPDSDSEPARKMLIRFLAHNFKSLQDDFRLLASESQDIVVDLILETLGRVAPFAETIQDLETKCAQKDSTIQALKASRCQRCSRNS